MRRISLVLGCVALFCVPPSPFPERSSPFQIAPAVVAREAALGISTVDPTGPMDVPQVDGVMGNRQRVNLSVPRYVGCIPILFRFGDFSERR